MARSDLSFSFGNTLGEVSPACLRIEAFLEEHEAHPRQVYCAQLVFEELATNIIRHALPDDQRHEIDVKVVLDDGSLKLTVEDDGKAFDPESWEPASPSSLEDTQLGGKGLLLVRRMSDEFSMDRKDGRNICCVRIAAPAEDQEQ